MKMLLRLIDRIVDWYLITAFTRSERRRKKLEKKRDTLLQAELTDLRIETERRQSEKARDPDSL